MEALPVVIAIILLFFLLLGGIPVAIALGATGIAGLILMGGFELASSVIGGTTYSSVGRANLVVVPMFILMGMLTLHSGIAQQLFALASRALKKLPGGLAVSTIFASAGFGAVTGSSLASVGTLGRTAITEMIRHGYTKTFASAAVAVSGSLAVLIPPSIILVLYGTMTNESVGELLMAGIIPGILSAVMLAGFAILMAKRKPALISVGGTDQSPETGRKRLAEAGIPDDGGIDLSPASAVRAILALALIFTIVIGGIYSGFFTPSESAAIGAVVALLLIVTQYMKTPRKLLHNLSLALRETVSLNSSIFLILVGAGIFSYFLVTAGVPTALSNFVVDLPVPPEVVVIMLLLVLIPGGMFLDSISLLVITVPLVYQPITDLGFDGLWLGILIVKLIELGMITPPIGLNAFVTAGTTPGLHVDQVFRGTFPYYIADFVIIAVIFMFPEIVTFLPEMSAA
ncbi:TRAP transporter large permease [Nesterenkonia flava]|uniref:TRAP transporter large permease n=1 Tax=Nesterenkonia flava TaxID=469799 RepID=A0ABU1FUB0_9MICC|nr:TRAP transporter large permease [Nesterenkonia flava]MDR5712251.1 TRAP transporter large permease [Nesterenkonia flava]